MEDIIRTAREQLAIGGFTDKPYLCRDVLELLAVFEKQDHERTSQHATINLFNKLSRFENLPRAGVLGLEPSEEDIASLRPWQQHAIRSIPRKGFFEFPDYVRNQSAMWRFSTYDNFLSQASMHSDIVSSACLSLWVKPKTIVEMGLHGGFTTLLLCKMNPEARVYGVDINSRLPDGELPIAYAAWVNRVNNLTVSIMNSWEFKMPGNIDLCFIDACHFLPQVQYDCETAWENRRADGHWVIAWDDYHPNNPDIYHTINAFVQKVGYPLQGIGTWVFISNQTYQGEFQ